MSLCFLRNNHRNTNFTRQVTIIWLLILGFYLQYVLQELKIYTIEQITLDNKDTIKLNVLPSIQY